MKPAVAPPTFLLLLLFALPLQAQTLRYLGQQILPHDYSHAGTTVGGLSGLDYDAASGRRLAEHVYVVDAVAMPPPTPGLFRTNGLVELLGGAGMLLALERGYTMGAGNSVKIYRLDLAAASDVANRPALAGTPFTPVGKTLLLDLGLLGVPLDNLEGMSWGPRLPNGRRSLVLVSDNNFSARQVTQFLLFACCD